MRMITVAALALGVLAAGRPLAAGTVAAYRVALPVVGRSSLSVSCRMTQTQLVWPKLEATLADLTGHPVPGVAGQVTFSKDDGSWSETVPLYTAADGVAAEGATMAAPGGYRYDATLGPARCSGAFSRP